MTAFARNPLTRSLILIVVLTALSGCASILSGTEDSISVNSVVDGTTLYVDSVPRGNNSATLTVQRGKTHEVTARKVGCQDATITTELKFDYRSLLGVFLDFGLVTIPIDFFSGAAMKTVPTTYSVSPICNGP